MTNLILKWLVFDIFISGWYYKGPEGVLLQLVFERAPTVLLKLSRFFFLFRKYLYCNQLT